MTDLDRSKPLHHIFTVIPPRYDLTNSIITLGMDMGWRIRAARECLKSHPGKVLDLCCGTGDLTLRLLRMADADVEVMGVDYSQPMLDIAAKKAQELGKKGKVFLIMADAAKLPFPDAYFDCVGISFAFRNLVYRNPMAEQHLSEVLRVLKPGGRFIIVESSQPQSPLLRWMCHLYLRWFVFSVGYLLSGNRQAYKYLAESAARFYSSNEVADMLINTGFRHISYDALFLGVAGIHSAVK